MCIHSQVEATVGRLVHYAFVLAVGCTVASVTHANAQDGTDKQWQTQNIGYRHVDKIHCPLMNGQLALKDFAIRSDDVLVAASKAGIVEFDGERWRLRHHPNHAAVHSLAIDENDRVYVGFKEDFGYFPEGEHSSFVSLRPHIKDPERNLGNFRRTFVTDRAVIFLLPRGIVHIVA